MMGSLPGQQNELLYEYGLEQHIPQDHLLIQIDQFLDISNIRIHLKPNYSDTGRPSIDPDVVDRLLFWHSPGTPHL